MTSPQGYWEFWDFCWFHCCTTSGNSIAAKKGTIQRMQILDVSLTWTITNLSQVWTVDSSLILVPKRLFRANWKKPKLGLSTTFPQTPEIYLPRIQNLAPRRNITRIFRRFQDHLLFTADRDNRDTSKCKSVLKDKLAQEELLQAKVTKSTWIIPGLGRQAGSREHSPPTGNVFTSTSTLTCDCCFPASGEFTAIASIKLGC